MFKSLVLFVILVSGLFASPYEEIKYEKIVLKDVQVVDGDTIKGKDMLTDKLVRVRLAYVDTMESVKNLRAKKIATKCEIDINKLVSYGKQAKLAMSVMLQKSNNNVVVYKTDKPDKDGREIGLVYGIDFNISFNEELVTNGYAMPFSKYIKEQRTTDLFMELYTKSIKNDLFKENEECLFQVLGK